jgi:hypothetical protein
MDEAGFVGHKGRNDLRGAARAESLPFPSPGVASTNSLGPRARGGAHE